MSRRAIAQVTAIAVLAGAAVFSALPVRASHSRAVDPATIDPAKLALPLSAIPPNLNLCLSGTVDASGQLTGGSVSTGTPAGALACGLVSGYEPILTDAALKPVPGRITVGGKTFTIKVGVTLDNENLISSLDHSAVSDNNDANAKTTPPDGYKTSINIIHQQPYDGLGRINGYRMDFKFHLGGALAGTEYLASVFPSADKAKAAMQDAIGGGSLITIIGAPLAHQCKVGDDCAAYSGPNPGTNNKAVLAIFYHGPILIETATQVPFDKFDALEPQLEAVLYGFLAAADTQIQAALNPGSQGSPTNTPAATTTATDTATPTSTATSTPVPPTSTPLPKRPAKKCKKNETKKKGKCICKKGYTKVHGKCVKKKLALSSLS